MKRRKNLGSAGKTHSDVVTHVLRGRLNEHVQGVYLYAQHGDCDRALSHLTAGRETYGKIVAHVGSIRPPERFKLHPIHLDADDLELAARTTFGKYCKVVPR